MPPAVRGRARASKLHYNVSAKIPSKKHPKKRSTTSLTYDLRWFTFGVDFCLFMVGILYAILVPFTKAEESFHMQASHDMLFHGYTNIQIYDHHQVPNVVPRTFIGSLLLSLMVQPFKRMTQSIFPLLFRSFNLKRYCSDLIRIALLSINIMSLSYFRTSFIAVYMAPRYPGIAHKKRELIKAFSNLFAILITAQLHYMFDQSRLVPNCFALPLITVAFGLYFRKKYHLALRWLAASTIIFRWDTIVIAFPFIVIMLLRAYWEAKEPKFHKILLQFISHGVKASVVCIALSLCIDSWFWNGYRSLKWPELEAFLDTIRNIQSSNGTPWHQYFTSHPLQGMLVNLVFIPCAMFKMNPIFCIQTCIGRYRNRDESTTKGVHVSLWDCLDLESIQLAWIGAVSMILYSWLPHQEAGFIFFVVPLFTLLSTIGCIRFSSLWGWSNIECAPFTWEYYRRYLYQRQSQCYFLCIPTVVNSKRQSRCSVSHIIGIMVIIAIWVSLVVSVLGVVEASYTYGGGKALEKFEWITRDNCTRSCYNYNNIVNGIVDINAFDAKCVHIGHKATTSGAIRFTVPSYCREVTFDDTPHVAKEDYAKEVDPCHLMEAKKRGYDYLITEHRFVPNYKLVSDGIIYAKSDDFSIFSYIKQMILPWNQMKRPFLKPTLYIQKRMLTT